jgi:NhaP-type Na+/H+ or K+/H+ antiporter
VKRIAARMQSDPIAVVLALFLLLALVFELLSPRNILAELVFGLTLGLTIGYNLRIVVEKRR